MSIVKRVGRFLQRKWILTLAFAGVLVVLENRLGFKFARPAVYVGLGLGATLGVVVFFLSHLWTKRRMQRILREMPEQPDTETSLAFWMRRPKGERDAAAQGLRRNPFNPVLRVLKKLGLFED